MRRAVTLAAAFLALAQAQVLTPAGPKPLPPPAPPASQAAPADRNAPRKLDSFGDKATRCLHYGGTQGVQPGDLGQYTRECLHSQ